MEALVKKHFGRAAKIENVVIPTLGGSNKTSIVELSESGGARRRVVIRQETYTDDPQSPFLSPADQFALLKVAHAHGLPVPEPLFELAPEDGLGRGYATAFSAGETMPKRLLGEARFAGARQSLAGRSAEVLAQLHAIPIAEVPFLEARPDSQDPIGAQLSRLDRYGEAHPALELGVRWLEKRRPASTAARRAIVHGDYRMGNLLVSENGLEAVLDWECAHLGDPLEDLGWLCVRSWRFGNVNEPVGGFGDRETLYARYREASGTPVDEDLVRWWEVFGMIRWTVLNIMQAYGHEQLGRRSAAYAACGRNASLYEYDLLMFLSGHFR